MIVGTIKRIAAVGGGDPFTLNAEYDIVSARDTGTRGYWSVNVVADNGEVGPVQVDGSTFEFVCLHTMKKVI